ncbi:hypothetical protein PQQ96_15495 [Paraburkholderia sediminicola]|uniref:hypothetical protein n=1 Tax=Paraburkholderia sediminicola TaxID=458836 RepID=UPI0038BD7B92
MVAGQSFSEQSRHYGFFNELIADSAYEWIYVLRILMPVNAFFRALAHIQSLLEMLELQFDPPAIPQI